MSTYEPSPRWGQFAVSIRRKLYAWGGRQDWSERGREQVQTSLEVFDPDLEVWDQHLTTGEHPPAGLRSGACAAIGDSVYICCGCDDGAEWYNTLHELVVTTRVWRRVQVRNQSEGPMRKVGCRMVAYEDKLALFAGLGIPSGRQQPGAAFVKKSNGKGETNEFHFFHTKQGVGVYTCTYVLLYQCPPSQEGLL